MLLAKLITTLKTYDRWFTSDLAAGVVVGIVALPASIAFAIASGVTPDRGLYTAVVAGFLISALGGSRVQIGGPTGAFVVIIYGIVQKYGVEGLTLATLMAGAVLIALGLAKLGAAIRFVPHPLITGFTAGIAVIIASGQTKGRTRPSNGCRAGGVLRGLVGPRRALRYRQRSGGRPHRGHDCHRGPLAAREPADFPARSSHCC